MSPELTTQTNGKSLVTDAEAKIEAKDDAGAVKLVEDAVLAGTEAEQDMTLRFAIGFCMPISLTKNYLAGWEVYKALQARRDMLAETLAPALR